MGYSCYAKGWLQFKKENADAVKEIMESFDYIDEMGDFETVDTDNALNEVEFNSYDINYHNDDWYEFYKELTPHIMKGSVEFTGEDDCFWKHSYEDSGTWKEYDGIKAYSEEGVDVA